MMRCYINCLSRYVSVTNSLLLTLSACPQVLQVARRLAEQVLSNCARKLQTYLTAAVNSLGVSLDKYSKIVALKYDGTFRTLPQDQLVKNEKEVSLLICFFTQPVLYLTRFTVRLPNLFVPVLLSFTDIV